MEGIDDRRAGVLVASASGDALGAGYEYGEMPTEREPVELCGDAARGLAPGEWTDDTAMAVPIAEAVARGLDPTGPEFEYYIVRRWLEWAGSGPASMGRATRTVLTRAETPDAEGLRDASLAFYARNPERAAGNGALMRTAPLALATMTEWGYFTTAEALSELTHADPVSGEACGIWTYAVHHALVHGTFDGVRIALEYLPGHRADHWAARLDEAETRPVASFERNGWVVEALQAAWAAIAQTPVPDDDPSAHLRLALEAAVRGGGDTDTVACIAGGLLGARWGASAVPGEWTQRLHGWPGIAVGDLVRLTRRDEKSDWLSQPLR